MIAFSICIYLLFFMIISFEALKNKTSEIHSFSYEKIHQRNERRRKKTQSRNVPIQRISVIYPQTHTEIYFNIFCCFCFFFTWCFSFQKESEHWLNFTLFQQINKNLYKHTYDSDLNVEQIELNNIIEERPNISDKKKWCYL